MGFPFVSFTHSSFPPPRLCALATKWNAAHEPLKESSVSPPFVETRMSSGAPLHTNVLCAPSPASFSLPIFTPTPNPIQEREKIGRHFPRGLRIGHKLRPNLEHKRFHIVVQFFPGIAGRPEKREKLIHRQVLS